MPAADGERLSQDELAVVLRRAAELEHDAARGLDQGLPVSAVEAAASEVGLPPGAVRQAVAELRAGMLPFGSDVDAPGPTDIVVARRVPFSLEQALEEADAFLAGKVFERVRDQRTVRLYRPRNDTIAKIQRAVDFAGRSKKLKGLGEVEVRAVPVEGGTLLRLTARMDGALVAAPKIAGGVVGLVGAGIFGTGLALGLDPDVVAGAIGAAAGVGVGGGTWFLVRAGVERERARMTEVLDGFLDDLELGRGVRQGISERLRRQLPHQFRGGWRA